MSTRLEAESAAQADGVDVSVDAVELTLVAGVPDAQFLTSDEVVAEFDAVAAVECAWTVEAALIVERGPAMRCVKGASLSVLAHVPWFPRALRGVRTNNP